MLRPPESPGPTLLVDVLMPAFVTLTDRRFRRPATQGSTDAPGVGIFRAKPRPIGTLSVLLVAVPLPSLRTPPPACRLTATGTKGLPKTFNEALPMNWVALLTPTTLES